MNPVQTLRRVVRNSDAIVQGIANQSDMINQKLDALIKGLDHQSKLLQRVVELQRAQLLQRDQAKAIGALGTAGQVPDELDFRAASLEEILTIYFTNSFIILRNFVEPAAVMRLSDDLQKVHGTVDELHVRLTDFTNLGLPHFHEYLFEQKHLDLLRAIFNGAAYNVSGATHSRVIDVRPGGSGMPPLAPHVDAFFHAVEFTTNFWVPFDSCGVDAPSLGAVRAGFKEILEYTGYDGGQNLNNPGNPWNLPRFREDMTHLANGVPGAVQAFKKRFAGRLCTPVYKLGDAMMISNWTLHFTHMTEQMTRSRRNVELRFTGDINIRSMLERIEARSL
jgi:hypothetical protein